MRTGTMYFPCTETAHCNVFPHFGSILRTVLTFVDELVWVVNTLVNRTSLLDQLSKRSFGPIKQLFSDEATQSPQALLPIWCCIVNTGKELLWWFYSNNKISSSVGGNVGFGMWFNLQFCPMRRVCVKLLQLCAPFQLARSFFLKINLQHCARNTDTHVQSEYFGGWGFLWMTIGITAPLQKLVYQMLTGPSVVVMAALTTFGM